MKKLDELWTPRLTMEYQISLGGACAIDAVQKLRRLRRRSTRQGRGRQSI
jgi:hypothetical protein